MKVLFLTNIPSPYRMDFFNELGKLCNLTVLFEREDAEDRNTNWLMKKNENFNAVFLKGRKIGADSALCIEVLKYLDKKKYDIFVIGGYSTPTGMIAIEYLNIKKIPFILNTDGGIIKNDKKFSYLIKKHYISSASIWLSTAKQTDGYLIHYGADKEKIHRYAFTSLKQNDILIEPICMKKKCRIRETLGMKEDKIILSVGQFIHRKGYDVLLNAVKNIDKDVGIYIIGGEPTDEYIELKKKLNLTNVHFIGFKSKDELKSYYEASDLFVLPTREDIWGLVINEAMAYALPVITTDRCIAGVELVKNYENGFIVPSEDKIQLAEKINIALFDDELLSKMSQNSLNKIKKYNIENMAKMHFDIFKKLIYKKR